MGRKWLARISRILSSVSSQFVPSQPIIEDVEMGWNDRRDDLSAEADIVAARAKAIVPCPRGHDEIMINNCDDDANSHAYALGTIRWQKGDLGWERQEFMDAIKDAIDQSADECPRCEKTREE
jgi:hypothetical protein